VVSHDLVITHLCGRLMVMHNGAEVETLDAASLAAGQVTQDHTRRLLAANAGFVRTAEPAAGPTAAPAERFASAGQRSI